MICPFALASCLIRAAPLYANLDRNARELRAIASSDQCIIDQEEFYIRGCLEIPIIGTREVFLFRSARRRNYPPSLRESDAARS